MLKKRISSLNTKERFIAGFILNKLWEYRYWCGSGRRQHLGHTSLDNLHKGRPRSDAGKIDEVAKELGRCGFINIFSATGEKHVCASRANEVLDEGLILVNEYRSSVGLPPLPRTEL
jgi:hypothetical protein